MGNGEHLSILPRAAAGLAAGVAGTLAIQQSMKAGARWLPDTQAPIQGDAGEYAVALVERQLPGPVRERIPQRAREVGAMSAHIAYGATAGALYALLRPRGGNVVRDGVALGLAVWAAGYLGWLPRAGLMPPVSEHTAPQLLGELTHHAAYGLATAAAFTGVARLLG
ncbi:MAG TPA: hypothetical protein VF832_10660 [Longimicrobiales bacterium]